MRARPGPLTAQLDVVFRGDPVVSDYGIEAKFAGDALGHLAAAVRAEVPRRPGVPEVSSRLCITQPIHGSFGFRLEELGQTRLNGSGQSDLAVAVGHISDVIIQAALGDPDEVTIDLNKHAHLELQKFFATLKSNGARVRFAHNATELELDPARIDLVSKSLESIEITDRLLHVTGRLYVLPGGRRFEIETEEADLFEGTLDPDVDYAREIEPLQQKVVKAVLVETTRKFPTRVVTKHRLDRARLA